MQQIKIFKSTEYRYKELEQQVNDWLKAEKVRVINMFGNIAPQTGTPDTSSQNQDFFASDLLIMVLYEAPEAG